MIIFVLNSTFKLYLPQNFSNKLIKLTYNFQLFIAGKKEILTRTLNLYYLIAFSRLINWVKI